MTEPFVGMQPIGGPMGATLPDGVVTVLPEGASDVRSSVSADVVQDFTLGFTSIPLPMTVQQVDGYSVAAAALSRSDFDAGSLGGRREVFQLRGVGVTWEGAQVPQPPEPSKPERIAAEETQLADGSVRLRFDAGDKEVIVDPSSGGASVVERAGGGWVVVAPQPVLLLSHLEPEPLAVVRTTAGLQAQPGPVARGTIGAAGSARRWVAVGVGDAVEAGDGAVGMPLPTMILDTSEGPWWASGDQPMRPDGQHEGKDHYTWLDWSIQEDLGLWAVQCTENLDIEREYPPSVGELARPTVQLIRCVDPFNSMQGFGFVVAVLPTEVAGEATLVEAEHEVDSPVHVSGQPQIVDLGAGRSLWTMDVSDNRPRGDDLVPVHPELNIEGLDLDDDGMVDVPWQ